MAEAPESGSSQKLQIKHDWYQTEAAVIITVLLRNLKDEYVKIDFSSVNVKVSISLPNTDEASLNLNLAHKIVPEQCSYKITPSKIEIKLKKCEGLRWDKLEGNADAEVIKAIPTEAVQESNGPPAYPTSKKGKDWSAIEKDIKKQEEQEKPEGEEALNKMFQEIYGKGSDEVKKAMVKSYMESGGTVLSTNWNEIAKQKVEVKPPDGMEFKKWND